MTIYIATASFSNFCRVLLHIVKQYRQNEETVRFLSEPIRMKKAMDLIRWFELQKYLQLFIIPFRYHRAATGFAYIIVLTLALTAVNVINLFKVCL